MDQSAWLRGIIFYILASLTVLGFGLIGHITLPMAIGFFSLYLM